MAKDQKLEKSVIDVIAAWRAAECFDEEDLTGRMKAMTNLYFHLDKLDKYSKTSEPGKVWQEYIEKSVKEIVAYIRAGGAQKIH